MVSTRRVLAIRFLAALAGSAAAIALVEVAGAQAWPATTPALFLPTLLVAAGVPLLLVFGAGHIPARPLAAALDGLARDADPAVTQLARAELSDRDRPEVGDNGAVLDPVLLTGRVTVLPKGRPFPAAILRADFAPGDDGPPYCFRPGYATCTLRFVALTQGAPEGVLLLDGSTAQVFDQDASGRWHKTGTLSGPVACDSVQRALKDRRFAAVANTGPRLVAAGIPLPLGPPSDGCPSDPER